MVVTAACFTSSLKLPASTTTTAADAPLLSLLLGLNPNLTKELEGTTNPLPEEKRVEPNLVRGAGAGGGVERGRGDRERDAGAGMQMQGRRGGRGRRRRPRARTMVGVGE
jgi:hypothetical protein